MLVIILTFGLAFLQLILGEEDGATIPPWAAQLAGVVVTGYFMSISASRMASALRKPDEETKKSDSQRQG